MQTGRGEMTMPDRETVIANIREDIDLLTHDRQPTTDELKIVNDLSAAVVLLEEQESIIESLKSDLYETLDVVANRGYIVRCRDCKNSGLDSSGINSYFCSAHTEWHDADWFCADGVKRDE